MSTRFVALWLAAVLAGLSSCASTGTPAPTSYSDSAQRLYEEGLEQLDGGDYMQAIQTFETVRTRFPYSSYAALAQLRIGDTEFKRGQYLAAVDVYQNFVRLHPTHPDVDWAAFRIGAAHYEAIPSDFFIFPPPSERDTTEARAAQSALEDFIAGYPESRYVDEARRMLREVLGLLARHELYVGDFYASRGKWRGAATRYETMLRTYPNVGYDEEATFKLVEALLQLDDWEGAAEALRRFLDRHPKGDGADRAKELLRELD